MHAARLHVAPLTESYGTATRFAASATAPASVGDADAASAVDWKGDDLRMAVHFRGSPAVVRMATRTVTLPRAVSASGARYTGGTWTYWDLQGTARLETPTRTFDGRARP